MNSAKKEFVVDIASAIVAWVILTWIDYLVFSFIYLSFEIGNWIISGKIFSALLAVAITVYLVQSIRRKRNDYLGAKMFMEELFPKDHDK